MIKRLIQRIKDGTAAEILQELRWIHRYSRRYLWAIGWYILLGVLVFTAPVAFSMGATQTTSGVFKSWCRMLGGQVFLLVMNAWCLRLFTGMMGAFLANPLSL